MHLNNKNAVFISVFRSGIQLTARQIMFDNFKYFFLRKRYVLLNIYECFKNMQNRVELKLTPLFLLLLLKELIKHQKVFSLTCWLVKFTPKFFCHVATDRCNPKFEIMFFWKNVK